VFDDKNEVGKVQYLADENRNELTIDKHIMVLANPEIAKLPNWVVAGGPAAGLCRGDSGLCLRPCCLILLSGHHTGHIQ
jgi:Na+(H+)/acetate symporter ActP